LKSAGNRQNIAGFSQKQMEILKKKLPENQNFRQERPESDMN